MFPVCLQVIFSVVFLYLVLVGIHLLVLVFFKDRQAVSLWPANRHGRVKTLIIMGSGGHTGEMIKLLSALNFQQFSPRLYLVAKTDQMSLKRLQDLEATQQSSSDCFQTAIISRSREVHQSWISTIITFMQSTLECMKIVYSYQPDLVLCNGPGTCVPPCLIAFILRALWIKRSTIVFVESICRVHTLSFTGKIMMYVLADRSIVQWPELHAKYPQTVYLGRLV